jgi:hypothetical protein
VQDRDRPAETLSSFRKNGLVQETDERWTVADPSEMASFTCNSNIEQVPGKHGW